MGQLTAIQMLAHGMEEPRQPLSALRVKRKTCKCGSVLRAAPAGASALELAIARVVMGLWAAVHATGYSSAAEGAWRGFELRPS